MRLSELVSNMSPTFFTQVAFVLFLLATGVIVYTVFTRRNRDLFDRARSMPLDDDGAPKIDGGELS